MKRDVILQRSKMVKCHTAWAVKITYPEVELEYKGTIPAKSFLAGRYYFQPVYVHPSNEGCHTALFKTRSEARKASQVCFYPTKVVKVEVTIEVVEGRA